MCVSILHILNKDMFGMNECENVEIVCKLSWVTELIASWCRIYCGEKGVFLDDRAWSQHWLSGSWLQAITFALVEF